MAIVVWLLAAWLWAQSASAQTFPVGPTASASSVGQGSAAPATDAAAWPVKVIFGDAQIDPRLVTIQNASLAVTGTFWQATQPVSLADNAARLLGQVTFSSPQPVTQSGTWNIGTLATITNPVAVTGTFWHATQPVSVASLPSHEVTNAGTFRVQQDHASRINCNVTSTATTSAVITGCAAPGAGVSIYITSLQWSSSIVSSTTNFMTIQDGTGGNCGANVTVHYRGYAAALTSVPVVFATPIKIDANSELCFLHPGAGTRLVNVQGYIAP